MTLDEVLSRLSKVSKSAGGYTARCPAHKDRNPSLSISEGSNGRVLLNCFAGCAFDDIINAMGISASDLSPDSGQSGKQIVAEYDYTDEDGRLLYQIVRYYPKDFRPRRPGFGGKWESGMADTRRVLYQLPDVIEAREAGKTIYICEGEKDADTLRRMDCTATCCAFGANSWRDEYANALEGGHVHVVPDNDQEGYKYADRVISSLAGIAASVNVVEVPPEYNDISDWERGSEGGLDIIDFASRTISAREWQTSHRERAEPDVTDAEDRTWTVDSTDHDSLSYRDSEMMTAVPMWSFDDPPPMKWLIEDIMPERYITILGADGGTGKSYLALRVMYSIATGEPFFNIPCSSARCLYVDYELQEEDQKRRWVQVLKGLGTDQYDERLNENVYFLKPDNPLSDSDTVNRIHEIVSRSEIGFIVVDSLTIAMGVDAKEQKEVTSVLKELERLSTVLAIDHVSIQTSRGNLSNATVYGSVFKRNISRSMWMLAKVDGGGLVLRQNKTNFGPTQDLVCFETVFDEDSDSIKFEARDLTDAVMGGALKALSTHEITHLAICDIYAEQAGPVTPEEIARWRDEHEVGIGVGTVRNHLSVLNKDGKVQNVGSNSWIPAQEHSSRSRPIGTVNSEDGDQEDSPTFSKGQRVETPQGNGVVEESELSVHGRLAVRLSNSGSIKYFDPGDLKPMV